MVTNNDDDMVIEAFACFSGVDFSTNFRYVIYNRTMICENHTCHVAYVIGEAQCKIMVEQKAINQTNLYE